MLSPETSAVIDSVISSPASADGLTPWKLPDGRQISPSGLVAALASLSARQVKELGLTISGISGRPGSISSASADLQRSLESRLQARLSGLGSTLYKLTWKEWATPSGVSRFRLRASVRRTSETERTGWPTPGASVVEHKSTPPVIGNRKPTDPQINTADVAFHLCGWPTPMAGTPAQNGNNAAGNNDSSRKTVAVVSGWPTPTASLADKGVRSMEGGIREAMRNHGPDLAAVSCIAGPARLTVTGELLTGSHAGMAAGGQLNPAHPRWVMGYPPVWDDCAVTAMPSSRSKRPSLSEPQKKAA